MHPLRHLPHCCCFSHPESACPADKQWVEHLSSGQSGAKVISRKMKLQFHKFFLAAAQATGHPRCCPALSWHNHLCHHAVKLVFSLLG